MAQELGIRLNHEESIAIGKKVTKAYYEKGAEKPSKHRQWVDGAECEVNSYHTQKGSDRVCIHGGHNEGAEKGLL